MMLGRDSPGEHRKKIFYGHALGIIKGVVSPELAEGRERELS